MKYDIAIIGGGIIGMSIAYEFARHDKSVIVIDRKTVIPQTSWAAVGILPAVNLDQAVEPFDQLRAISDDLHMKWSHDFKEATGIDNELKSVGTLFVARTRGEIASLSGYQTSLQEDGIEFENVSQDRLDTLFPSLSRPLSSRGILEAVFVPGEKTIRNTRHMKALNQICESMGVQFLNVDREIEFVPLAGRIDHLNVGEQNVEAENFCFASGSWTQTALESLGVHISTVPIRGQIALFKIPKPRFHSVIYEGSQYLVPRDDGHVLAGSTLEDVGFDNSTTSDTVSRLVAFANDWEQELNESTMVTSWAGLRPGTHDGMPYIGKIADFDNAYTATGHFRSGIHMSPGTAMIMYKLINGFELPIDISIFSPCRG